MFDKPIEWLNKNWWGLIVAYVLVLISIYFLIWQFAEPLSIPDNFESLPEFAKSRIFIHIILTFLIGSHIVLILDLVIRKKKWKIHQIPEYEWVLLGVWKGEYAYKDKRREITLNLYSVDHTLQAEIQTITDQGLVKQKANSKIVSEVSFSLNVEEITTGKERKTKWRPETWECVLSRDIQGHDRISAKIIDINSTGETRIVASPILYKVVTPKGVAQS